MRIKPFKAAKQVGKIHGANEDSMIVAHQGTSRFYNDPSMEFPKGGIRKVKGKKKY